MQHIKKMKIHYLFIALLTLPSSLFASALPAVVDPMATATPPGVTVSAGYLSLVNESSNDIEITGASSTGIARVEMHLSTLKGDVARMEKQEQLLLKANSTLVFEHGGYHLMLMDLKQPLKDGDSIDIILATSIGDLLIEMPVRKPELMHNMQHKAGADTHNEMKENSSEHANNADGSHMNSENNMSTDLKMNDDQNTNSKPILKDIK